MRNKFGNSGLEDSSFISYFQRARSILYVHICHAFTGFNKVAALSQSILKRVSSNKIL